jgi:hypothetical protein
MYQQPQMPQAPEGYMYQQPQMQAPQQPMAPEGYMYQAPQMPQAPQGQPQMQMPNMGQPMMGAPVPPQFMGQPQMPPQMPFMGQPMMGAPIPPQFMGQPQQGGSKGGSGGGCSHDHQSEDPFAGMFGMFGEMVNNNPNLSALNKVVGATNSDFLKGAMIGAGLTLLLTSDGVKDMLAGLFAGTMDMFNDEEDIGEEDE